MEDKKYSYQRFGCDSSRVGQAVHDILSKEQPDYTAEEIMEGMAPKISKEFYDTVEKGNKLFDKSYLILMYFNKTLTHLGVSNVMKMGFLIGDKKEDFDPIELTCKHPNWDKTLYKIDPKGSFEIVWHLPDFQRCQMIAKSPQKYHPDLSKWITECLDKGIHSSKAA